jgi:hypothetical protein
MMTANRIPKRLRTLLAQTVRLLKPRSALRQISQIAIKGMTA